MPKVFDAVYTIEAGGGGAFLRALRYAPSAAAVQLKVPTMWYSLPTPRRARGDL